MDNGNYNSNFYLTIGIIAVIIALPFNLLALKSIFTLSLSLLGLMGSQRTYGIFLIIQIAWFAISLIPLILLVRYVKKRCIEPEKLTLLAKKTFLITTILLLLPSLGMGLSFIGRMIAGHTGGFTTMTYIMFASYFIPLLSLIPYLLIRKKQEKFVMVYCVMFTIINMLLSLPAIFFILVGLSYRLPHLR